MKIREILEQIEAITNTKHRISARQVPHVVFFLDGMQQSACYFAKRKIIKVFYPYQAPNQSRLYFDSVEEFNNFYQYSINK